MTDSPLPARGTFETSNWAPGEEDLEREVAIARVTLDKRYQGALEGTSSTTLLTVAGPGGPAAYVGIERFQGNLDGEAGMAVLRHSVEAPPATARLIAAAGTGVFAGRAGVLTIEIDPQGTHHYTLDLD